MNSESAHPDPIVATTPAATASPPRSPSRRRRARALGRWTVRVLAGIGAVSLALSLAGLTTDALSFDRTSGGSEPPYTDWTGTPTDWSDADITAEGFRFNGRVMDVLTSCDDGMITFSVYGTEIDFRPFSERALAIHEPREACVEYGFEPGF